MNTAVVPVKGALSSKVNWIAALTTLAAVLSQTTDLLQQILPFVPPQYQHYITIGIMLVGGIATIITRTFFTTADTTQSMKGQP